MLRTERCSSSLEEPGCGAALRIVRMCDVSACLDERDERDMRRGRCRVAVHMYMQANQID